MKVVIVSCVYPPETVVAGRMVRDLAEYLLAEGNAVTVVAPYPSRPRGSSYPGFDERSVDRMESRDGTTVVRLNSYANADSGVISRARESWSFGRAAAAWIGRHSEGVDVIYEVNWPLFAKHLVGKASRSLGIPRVTTVMDVYPEALLIKLPKWAASLVRAPLTYWDRSIVQAADKLVVVSHSQRNLYLTNRGLLPDRVEVVCTWQDESRFQKVGTREEAAMAYNIDCRRFTFMYLGNIGPVAGVEHLIRSFHLAQLDDAQLVVAGEGSRKASCRSLAESLGKTNIHFLSDGDINNVARMQTLADVFLLPMVPGTGSSSIPSKLGAYMLSGKPILAAVDIGSDTAKAIREGDCGWVGPAGEEMWLANEMRRVAGISPTELDALGRRAKAYGLKNFSKCYGVRKLASIINEVSRRPRTKSLVSRRPVTKTPAEMGRELSAG